MNGPGASSGGGAEIVEIAKLRSPGLLISGNWICVHGENVLPLADEIVAFMDAGSGIRPSFERRGA
jgi:hypothetical protein